MGLDKYTGGQNLRTMFTLLCLLFIGILDTHLVTPKALKDSTYLVRMKESLKQLQDKIFCCHLLIQVSEFSELFPYLHLS